MAAVSPGDAVLAKPVEARKRRILVVDDSPLVRTLLVEILDRAGYETRTASDGAAGLEALERFAPDLDLGGLAYRSIC